MSTWAEFREQVIVHLTVHWERRTLRRWIEQMMRDAVLDLQKYINAYREDHQDVYSADRLVIHGTASIGRVPTNAYIQQFRFKSTGYVCVDHPLDVESWQNRHNLACCDTTYKVAIDPVGTEFWVNPQVTPGSEVVLHWNGRKSVWSDSDIVKFDDDAAAVVAEYCLAKLTRVIDKDLSASRTHMEDYEKMRRSLYLTVREQKWPSETGDRETAIQCAPSCSPYDMNTAIEWVCFGDSGDATVIDDTAAVATQALRLQPDFIIHLGDTNYPHGDPVTVYDNLIKHFPNYFRSAWYQVMGNHDYDTDIGAYLLSQLPNVQALMDEVDGASYCYKFTRGPVEFFVVNTGGSGADVIDESTAIPQWLTAALAASTATWKIVCMHKAPNTSDTSYYPGVTGVDWDALPGAHAVLMAHGHNYERFHIDGQPRFVIGTGGAPMRGFHSPPATGSQFRYNTKHGVLRCSADSNKLQFVFYNTDNEVVDNFTLYPTT